MWVFQVLRHVPGRRRKKAGSIKNCWDQREAVADSRERVRQAGMTSVGGQTRT